MLIDAHTHLDGKNFAFERSAHIKENKIFSLMCGSHPEDCLLVSSLANENPYILPTLGLHPWKSDHFSLSQMKPYLEKTKIIGEIGMDDIWCHVPLDLQETVFKDQLEIAERRNCPVILHTKGQEKRVAEIIKSYSMPVLVHWFSSEYFLESFIKRDCYFTVGPDFKTNPSVKNLVECVDLDRLFVETDGFSALEWVFSRKMNLLDIPKALENTIEFIANVKKTSIAHVERAMEENLIKFCGIDLKQLV